MEPGDFLRKVNKLNKKAINELRSISEIILFKLNPHVGPSTLFYHQGYCIVRVRDIGRLLTRMHKNSIKSIKLARSLDKIMPKNYPPAGITFPKNIQRIMRKNHELNEYLRIDYESMFLFGDILLDQWAITIAYLMGFSKPDKFSFHKLIEQIEKEGNESRLLKLWSQKRSELIWLDSHIRFYRNRFITHVDRPLQKGTTRSVYEDRFQLFTPSPPDWIDDEEFKREMHPLTRLLPGYDKGPPHDYWLRRRPLTQLEYLFSNIVSIESKKDREEIQRLMGKYGGATPDYKIIGLNLISFIVEANPLVVEEAIKHIKKINLGNSKKK